jgi:hypothetical protein
MKKIIKNINASEDLWRLVSYGEISFVVRYFTLEYKTIPHIVKFKVEINFQKVRKILSIKYKNSFEELCFFKEYKVDIEMAKNRNVGYVFKLKEGLFIDISKNEVEFAYCGIISKREIIELKNIIFNNHIPNLPELRKFYMITRNLTDYILKDFDIKEIDLNLKDNYNDEFSSINQKLTTFIDNKDTSGMVLLHGLPGSGKTTYLRYLISQCKARFIYLPNSLFCELSNPEFFTFILNYSNSVIILEDCEELLKPRDQSGNNIGISTLLNLSDGLLGDAMRLKIICTFNTEVRNIDSALLRKGRLAYKYEFGPLSVLKVNKLFKKLKIDYLTDKPLLLADIYSHLSDNGNNNNSKTKIGF